MEENVSLFDRRTFTAVRAGLMDIISSARILEDSFDETDSYENMDFTTRIIRAGYRILAEIINYEEYTRLDDYRPETVCLTDLVDDLVALSSVELRRAKIKVLAEKDCTGNVFVSADPDRLVACLMNLITNAAQNVAEDMGVIKVRVSKLNNSASVTVSHNGYPMSEEELMGYLSDENHRGGLAVVGKFCRAAGTSVYVDSDDGIDGGTVISFRLPLADGFGSLKSNKSCLSDDLLSPVKVFLAKVSGSLCGALDEIG